MLRKHGVVGKFVEFYGEGVGAVPLANRATIGNMSPEFGSTAAIFPIDERDHQLPEADRPFGEQQLALVEAYAKEQGLWLDPAAEPDFSEKLELDLSTVVPSIAGPKRPQDRIVLADAAAAVLADAGRAQLRTRRTRDCSVPVDEASGVLPGLRRPGRRPNGAPSKPGHRDRPRRLDVRDRPRRRHGRRDHLLHQHLEPVRHGRRRAGGQEGRGEGPDPQAVGQDHPRPRLQGRHRLLRQGRPDPVPRQGRLQPRRLRLHHLHRQLRPAAGGGLQGRQRPRPRRRLGPLRQPQLRGPDQPRRQDELPGVPAAGRRLRPRRFDEGGHHHATRWASTRTASRSTSPTSGRPRPRSTTSSPTPSARRCSTSPTRTSSRATPSGRRCRSRPATPSSGTRSPPTCASPRTSRA